MALPSRQMMIPQGNANRPGSKLNPAPLWITIHETANPSPGADAEMHAIFVRNGGGTEGVSFHGTVDDHEAIQMLPADEVGYHAGDGCNSRTDDLGCFQSFAIETCVNAGSSWSQTKKNLVDYCAAIITGDPRIDFAGRKGQFSVDRIAQHNKWSGKNCPAKIRAEGSWNSILAAIRARVAEIEGGTTPVPEPPKPPEPDIIPGVDFGIAKRAFDNPDLPGYVLTKGGKLSELYIARVKQTGKLSQLMNRWPYDDGRVYYRFSNGDVALFTESDKKIRWIEEAA
jgi:N-acetylmuramoyl-L-alanine amidase